MTDHSSLSSALCPPVSVILPTRNEASIIAEVLAAVLAQDYPRDLIEVIAVDGMSDDGTRDIVRCLAAQDARLKMLDNPQQITPAGLNLAIRAACGAVIVRVDGHGVVPPNYVRECVAFLTGAQSASPLRLDRGEGQGEVSLPFVISDFSISASQLSAFEGTALLAVGGAWDSVGLGLTGEVIAIAVSSRFGVGNSRYRTCGACGEPTQTDTVPFWAMRRQVFERIGLFREEMLCHEDYEFNYRLRQSGGKILLLPWLRSKYYVRSTLGSLARQYWRYGIWKGRFLCSHPESLKARHLIPPLFVAALAAGALVSFRGAAGRFYFVSLVALYVGFLLAAAANLTWSRARRREGVLPKSSKRVKVGRAVPSAPGEGGQISTFQASVDTRGALGTARPTSEPLRQHARETAADPKSEVGPWRCALLLPIILATLHLCWGAGIWVGLARGKVDGQPPRLAA